MSVVQAMCLCENRHMTDEDKIKARKLIRDIGQDISCGRHVGAALRT